VPGRGCAGIGDGGEDGLADLCVGADGGGRGTNSDEKAEDGVDFSAGTDGGAGLIVNTSISFTRKNGEPGENVCPSSPMSFV
jgi:hypothetical protein